MAKKAGARYLDSSITVQNKTLRGRLSLFLAAGAALIAILGTIFMGALVAYSAVDTNRTVLAKADAALNFCGVIGQNMDGRSSWRANWDVALADANQRRFTLSEVVPNSTWWSHFSGAGSGDGQEGAGKWNEVVDEVNAGRPDAAKLPKTEDLPAPLHENRNLASCTLGTIPGAVGSFGINFANFVTKIASFVSTMAFNSSFICDADGVPAGSVCVDLVKVIGGRGNDAGQGGSGQGGNSGIIGSLTSGLYMPLMIIVVLITALSVFWTGIVKRKYRDALFQAIWLFASVIVGLALLLNPSMLVKAPMVAGNTVVGCVVGSFNGTGCFGGNSGGGSVGSSAPTARENICASSASGITAEQTATLYVNSMSCAIWSAFVLEPYAQGAFGVSLSQLDLDSVIDASNGQTVRELLSTDGWSPPGGFAPENICVNLQSNNSYRGMGSTFQGASNTSNGTAGAVCNLAVWDLFMKTNAVGGGVTSANNNPDNQWLSVMSRLPANQDLWNNYTGDTSGLSKIAMGTLAAFASLLGSALIILVSVMALAYYVIAIVMVAFAPVFFLLGMHPGRGRKIMLGWVEQIVGNILKYIISAVFLLIAITFYGAILGTTETLLGSLLFVTIITVALFLYRKELISLLSRVEMGGEKVADFGSKTSEIGQKIGGAVWRPTKAVAAGAIAGAATGAGTRVGAQAAISRELRRGNGLGARAWQAADAISKDNADDLYKTEVAKQKDADIAQKTAANLEKDAEKAVKELDPIAAARDEAEAKVVKADANQEVASSNILTKQRLDVEVMTQFPEGDYARKRADKTFEVEDEDGNKRFVTSSEAFKDINNTANQLNDLRAKRAELMMAGDKTADTRFLAEERELEAKLKVGISSFQANHKLGGSANAYVDLKQNEAIRDDYEISRKEALRTGNEEEAADMAKKISAIDMQISTQRSVYQNVYGAAELKTATDQYDRTTDEYIKHRIPLQDQEDVRALSKKSYGELNDQFVKAQEDSAAAVAEKNTADLKYDVARNKAGERITAASEARTDAEFRKAEAAHLSEARKNITPGEIVTAGHIKKTLEEAEAYAGVQAARNSNFGKDLRETIEKLNEREAGSSLVPEAELPARPVVRGENVRAAEERSPERVDVGDYKAGRAAVAETVGKITAAEKEVAEAEAQVQRETQRAQREAERPRRGSANEALQAAKEQARAEANRANNDYFATRSSFDESEKKLNTLRNDDISNGSGLPSQDLLRAEAERDEIQSRLTNLDQAKRQAEREYAEASRALVESSRTQALVDAENRLKAAKAKAEEVIPKFERQVSIPSATFKSVETDQNMVNKLNELQDNYNKLAESVRGGGKFSTEDKAKLVEVERRISNLGANPTQGEVTQIVQLLPAEPKDKGGSSRTQAQETSGALPDIAPIPQPRQTETALPDFEPAPRRPQPINQPQPQSAPVPEPARPAPSPTPEPQRPAPQPEPQRPAQEPQRPAPQPEPQQAPRSRERPASRPEQRENQNSPRPRSNGNPTPDGPLPDLNDTGRSSGGRNGRPQPESGRQGNSGRDGSGEGRRFNPNGNGGRGGNNGPGDINPPPKNNR